MLRIRRTVSLPPVVAWILALGVPLVLGASLIWRAKDMRHGDKIEAKNHVHLPTGVMDASDGTLFTFEQTMDERSFRVRPDKLTPVAQDGSQISSFETGDPPKPLLVGRYFYRFTYVAPKLGWKLIGARVRINDTVGRNPAFWDTGTLAYEPRAQEGHDLALWIDGMPSRAFTVRSPQDCNSSATSTCLEIEDSTDRITLERAFGDSVFEHLHSHQKLTVQPEDHLWIANFPFSLSPVANSSAVDLVLSEDFETRHGNRIGLGPPGLNGSAEIGANGFVFEDVTAQFRENHLGDHRWDPETEDEMQLLIDSGLLCLAYTQEGTQIVPQITWTDLTTGACADPLGLTPRRPIPAVDERILKLYSRRRLNDQLIARTNERLKHLPSESPEDFPFVFEWWPVSTSSGWARLPVRIWGMRTGSTLRVLNPAPDVGVEAGSSTDTVVLRSREGTKTVLARSFGKERIYAQGDALLGLGPLLGIRGAIDGLDEISSSATRPNNADLSLTIDPELQGTLWESLKAELGPLGTNPRTFDQSVYFGISGIVMDAENGDVLSVLNWPAGLVWENSERFKELRAEGGWGVPRPPLNWAMLRADKVGSVFKLLAIYSMAESGVLDHPKGIAGPSCQKSPFGTMITHNGRVSIVASSFEDGQLGPMPVGPTGLLGSLDGATATSCNTYFSLAATMLLDSDPPELEYISFPATCPIDNGMRRTDTGKPTSREWLLCERRDGGKSRKGQRVHWLLLPEGENLGERSRRAFEKRAKRTTGYFDRAIQAGFRLGYPDSAGALSGRHLSSYENATYRDDWMPGLPNAEGHVFLYPMMFSPLSFFGGGHETFGDAVQNVEPNRLTWRDFASQAIGEAGQGSALTVAVMYAGVARKDGAIPAPRLIEAGDISTRQMFDPQGTRLERIQQALRQPLFSKNGTGWKVGKYLTSNHIEGVVGKTGTFVVEARAERSDENSTDGSAEEVHGCGFVREQDLLSPSHPDERFLGTAACEKRRYMTVTGVHRYPEMLRTTHDDSRRPDSREKVSKETHTTFAAVIQPKTGHPVVIAIIVDLDEYRKERVNSRDLIQPLLKDISDWMK